MPNYYILCILQYVNFPFLWKMKFKNRIARKDDIFITLSYKTSSSLSSMPVFF